MEYYNIDDLGRFGIELTDNQKERAGKLRQDFIEYGKYTRLHIMIGVYIRDGICKTLDSIICAVEIDGFFMMPGKMYNEKTYRFYTVNPFRHRHSKNYVNNNEMPKRVGAPTPAKLKAWVDYLKREGKEMMEYAQRYIREEEEMRDKLNQLGELVNWENANLAVIKKGNLVFKVSFEECRISKKTEIDEQYNLSLDDFLLMSDNKYITKKQ